MTDYSTEHINYLERSYLDALHGEIEENPKDFLLPDDKSVRLVKILGIPRQIASVRYLMEDAVAGCYGEKVPLIYLIIGDPSDISLYMGTFRIDYNGDATRQVSDESLTILMASLQSAYTGIYMQEQGGDALALLHETMSTLSHAGVVVGTPTIKVTKEFGVVQIERLIQGMYGTKWGYLAVAMPIHEQDVVGLYNSTLNELRITANAEAADGMQSPLAEKYKELLGVLLTKIELGKTQGMWHTAAYFLAQDTTTFGRGKAVTKSVFGGEHSRPDPVRILECHNIRTKIHQFAQITTPAPPPLGKIKYPFKYLSMLNSNELVSMMQLPTKEMPGYFVRNYARFDVASHYNGGSGEAIRIGEIIDQTKGMGCEYQIKLGDLKRHGLIVGTTGSGKTNTVFWLIEQTWQNNGIPFMVVEPAKTEYRKLLQSDFGKDMQVFTLGDNTVSPFRLNPFEIMPGVSVQTHIDHLKSVFNASFIMYAPMPYVLEQCIHEIYQEKGWDLVTGESGRGHHTNAQPTLTDLYGKIDEVVGRLGYETRITMDVRAALKTRIDSLRIGGKGLMLDTRKSIPIETLIKRPTVLEIEKIGDDDEKAFLIGLLLLFLYEYYVSHGLKEDMPLSHITVIEEAHRLFKNVPVGIDTEVANSKGKAVETFCNMLSEIRAYGEGFLIADQIPSKLAPDIIKNTNLKIMHRIVAEDDRIIMGGAMNMDDDDERYIASLSVGEAAIYSEGDDASILTRVPYRKIDSQYKDRDSEDRAIRKIMQAVAEEIPEVFAPFRDCLNRCKAICKYKRESINIVQSPEFNETLSRYVVSAVFSEQALIGEFPQLYQCIIKLSRSAQAFPEIALCTLISGLDDYFESTGHNYGWKYSDVDELKKDFSFLVHDIALKKHEQSLGEASLSAKEKEHLRSFADKYRGLCRCRSYTFAECRRVCQDNVCVYKYNIQPLLDDKRLHDKFISPMGKFSDDKKMWANIAQGVSQIVVRKTIASSVSSEEKQKASLCFAIQKSESRPEFDYFHKEKIVTGLINAFQEFTWRV